MRRGAMPERTGVCAALLAVSAVVALTGCGSAMPAAPPTFGLAPGWSPLGPVPWPADEGGQISFWTGEELVVAGGFNHVDETRASFATSTYSYSPGSLQWTELEPLSVPGYDGVISFGGAWIGSSWVGLGLPCRSGPTPDLFVSDACGADPIELRWEAEHGWSVGFDVVPGPLG